MANLPTVGGDDGTWGSILNTFLSVAHNADGTIKGISDTTAVHRMPVLIVAASDAPTKDKELADYVCDGTADESEISDALTALDSVGGGTVQLTAGNYNFSTQVTISQTKVSIAGVGRGTIITSSSDINFLLVSSTATDIDIYNLSIVTSNTGRFVPILGGKRIRVYNCYFEGDSHSGVNASFDSVNASSDVLIYGNVFVSCVSAIAIDRPCSRIIAANNRFYTCRLAFSAFGDSGISDVTITGNVTTGGNPNVGGDYFFKGVDNLTVTGNSSHVLDGYNGIYLYYCTNSTVSGNSVKSDGTSGGSGIVSIGTENSVLFIGNSVSNFSKGLDLQSGSGLLVANKFVGTTTPVSITAGSWTHWGNYGATDNVIVNAITNTSDGTILQPSAAANIPLSIKGAASQSGDLMQILNSGGTVLSRINSSGQLQIVTSAGAPSGTPTNGTMVYDTTNNKLYVYNGGWKSVTLT